MSDWTIDQAAELMLEQVVSLLDGCDDDDTTRPALVWEAILYGWLSPEAAKDVRENAPEIFCLSDDLTAGELRARARRARRSLAEGEGP